MEEKKDINKKILKFTDTLEIINDTSKFQLKSLTNSMTYRTPRFNAAFTRALQ